MQAARIRALEPATFLAAGLALSIGWGIRGNFGHEYGAMMPGALAALAVCILSGREDWRARAPYFAMFGALGWAFGGSISYMQVIAYTHSGHLPSQVYGFACLFVIGLLWGGLGGAGTAFAATADRERLTAIFRPLCWVLATMWLLWLVLWGPLEYWYGEGRGTWTRHEGLFYWFDTDWREAVGALIGVFLFDLWDRRAAAAGRAWRWAAIAYVVFGLLGAIFVLRGVTVNLAGMPVRGALRLDLGNGAPALGTSMVMVALVTAFAGALLTWAVIRLRLWQTFLFALGGAMFGLLVQAGLSGCAELAPDIAERVQSFVVQVQGAPEAVAAAQGISVEAARAKLLINWPLLVLHIPEHLGWILGAFAGVCVYFRLFGRFRAGSTLFLYMAAGWLIAFLIGPVLLGFGGAGLRMTPPRGDDWAGILGVFLGTLLWCYRNQLVPVAFAGIVSGIVGGLGFAGAAYLKLLLMAFGNPARLGATDPAWAHWHRANWHSFLEQSYGFINGLGIALALGLLAYRLPAQEDRPRNRRWTEVFAVAFVLFGVTWVNLAKNPKMWVENKSVPEFMKMPLFGAIELSAQGWFALIFTVIAGCGMLVMTRHLQRPVALVPASATGRAQLLFLVFLWAVVVGNFERALPGFSEQRLLTEGVLFIHAAIVSVIVLLWPREGVQPPATQTHDYAPDLLRAFGAGAMALLICAVGMTTGVRMIYRDAPAGHAKVLKRFGPDAAWVTEPLLRGERHR